MGGGQGEGRERRREDSYIISVCNAIIGNVSERISVEKQQKCATKMCLHACRKVYFVVAAAAAANAKKIETRCPKAISQK